MMPLPLVSSVRPRAPERAAKGSSRRGSFLALALILLVPCGSRTEGAVIQSFNVGGTGGGNAQDPGIRLTTPTGGPWTNITFNWYRVTSGASYAIGTLFLLDREYLGTPQALSSSTSGYLASASGNGSLYTFSPTLTLQGNTQYYFYADLGLSNGTSTEVSSSSGDLATSLSYGAGNGNLAFASRSGFDLSYSLNSTAPGVPENAATALLLLFPGALVIRRHFRASSHAGRP